MCNRALAASSLHKHNTRRPCVEEHMLERLSQTKGSVSRLVGQAVVHQVGA